MTLPLNPIVPGSLSLLQNPVVDVSLPWFDPRDYGAKGDGITDDTAAIQAAVSAATDGGTVVFAPGYYKVSSTITVTKPISLQGTVAGYDSTGLGSGILGVQGVSTFECSSDQVAFRDLLFLASTTEAAATSAQTCAIKFTSGDRCFVERCRFSYFYIGVWFANCQLWTVADNYFWMNSGYHMLIQNVASPDGGDQNLRGNVFQSGTSTWPGLAQVRQESAGGTRVVGNKFYRGPIAYQVAPTDGASTSILLVTGNSFELQSYAHFHLTPGTGGAATGKFTRINITGNQFTSTLVSAGGVYNDATTNMFDEFMFNNNIMVGTSGSTVFVQFMHARGLTVVGNYFNTGLSAVLALGDSTNVVLHPNNCAGVTGTRYRIDGQTAGATSTPVEMVESKNFSLSDSVNYTTVAQIQFNAVGGCVLDLNVVGNTNTGVSIAGTYRRLVQLDAVGGAATVTTVGTDVTGTIPFDVQFNTGTNNQVLIKMKRNGADGMTNIYGSANVRVVGSEQLVS